MKTRLILTLFAVLASLMWAQAAELSNAGGARAGTAQRWYWSNNQGIALPFPRSERAQRVRAADMCWTECSSICAWGQNVCLQVQVDEQGNCLAWSDACDRSCLRQCRSGAGPFLPLD